MGIYTYSPETNAKINKLCRDCAVLAMLDFPDEDLDALDDLFNQISILVRNGFASFGARQYLLILDLTDLSTTNTLDIATIAAETLSGNNVFIINKALNALSVEKMDQVSNISVARYSKDKRCLIVSVHNGIDISIYSLGVPIEQRNLHFPSAKPILIDKFSRPAEDYKVSLIEFYKEKVRTNLTKHWHDPKKRILKGGQTEDIFQVALVEWLVDNLTAKKINFKVKKISTDETDIEIIKHGGETYLLELKWLGKNEKSDYPLSKLTAAIDQVENYLEADLEVLEATLVVYDGRPITEFQKLIFIEEESGNWKEVKECETKKLSFRGTAFVFHLISETSSKRKSA